MPVSLQALQAAADGGKAGLAAYDEQRKALAASKQQAVEQLIGQSRGVPVDAAGIAAALGQTGGRGDAILAGGARTAGMRQNTLGGVPGYLASLDAAEERIAPEQARVYGEDHATQLRRQLDEENKARTFKKRQADTQFDFDKQMFDRKLALKRGF